MSSEKVTVTLTPICECGYIFKNGIICHRETMELSKSGYTIQQLFFEPSICPNCKRAIDCIQYINQIQEEM